MNAIELLRAIAEPITDADVCRAARLAVNDVPGLFLDWLADHAARTPSDAILCQRVAGNVRKLAGL